MGLNLICMDHTIQTIYICPMHPEVRQTGPGKCLKCGMALVIVDEKSIRPIITVVEDFGMAFLALVLLWIS